MTSVLGREVRTRRHAVVVAVAVLATLAGGAAHAGNGRAPDDPDAAKRAITRTWEATAAVTDAESMASNLHLVDDPTGLVEANRQAFANFPYELSHDTDRITDIRFTSPTRATVTWDILIENGPTFSGQVGEAVLVDGDWKMTRSTACRLLALAGGMCEPPPSEPPPTVPPPPTLPPPTTQPPPPIEPGVNAPDDPVAAKRAITRTWEATAAVTDAESMASNLHLVDDPTGLVEANRQAFANFPYELSHDTDRITDIRFTSPTRATVTWDILIDGERRFPGQVGEAVLVDGDWKMTRTTACRLLALAGGLCEPPPDGTFGRFGRLPVAIAQPPAPIAAVPRFTG